MRVWIFSTFFPQTHLSLYEEFRDMEYKIPWKSVQCEPTCSMQADEHDEASILFSRVLKSGWNGLVDGNRSLTDGRTDGRTDNVISHSYISALECQLGTEMCKITTDGLRYAHTHTLRYAVSKQQQTTMCIDSLMVVEWTYLMAERHR
jgi:hypothetical protein